MFFAPCSRDARHREREIDCLLALGARPRLFSEIPQGGCVLAHDWGAPRALANPPCTMLPAPPRPSLPALKWAMLRPACVLRTCSCCSWSNSGPLGWRIRSHGKVTVARPRIQFLRGRSSHLRYPARETGRLQDWAQRPQGAEIPVRRLHSGRAHHSCST